MKKRQTSILSIIIIFLISLATSFVFAESSEIWIKTFGGSGDDEGYSIQFADEGYIIAGMSNSSGYGGYDALLIKTNSEGLVEWNKTYGNQFNDMAHSVIKTINGGYVFAGSTSSSMSENFFQSSDYWLVKIDSLGNYEWDQSFDNEEFDSCRSVIATKDGGYALLGYSGTIDRSNQPFGFSDSDVWLVKVDSLGNHQWNQTYGGDNLDSVSNIIEADDNGYVIGGSTASSGNGSTDFWLIKVDSLGNPEWNQTYGGSDYEFGNSLVKTSDGGYAITGSTGSFSVGSVDVWLVKVDSLGNHQWNQTYGGEIADYCDSMVNSRDGGFTLACITQTPRFGDGVFWLIQVDSAGNLLENQTYGLSAHHSHTSLLITEKNNYVLAGSTRDQFGFRDFWIGEISGPNEKSTIEFLSLLLIIATLGVILYIVYKKIWFPKRAIKN